MTNLRIPTFLAAISLALAACGGSDGSTTQGGGTATTRGAISAVSADSITVNGVRLSISPGTAIRIDDNPGGHEDLQVGMVVTVKGTMDDRLGGASEVEYHHGVRGKVTSADGDLLRVGEIEVHRDPSTVGTAVVGNRVRVSGVPDDKGGLRATRIDDSPGTDDSLEVKGFVSSLDATAKTFELRLTPDALDHYVVDWNGLGALPAGVGDGSYVEVHSSSPATLGTIVASSIELEDRLGGAQGEVELEGIVTSDPEAISGGLRFVVDGVTVETTGSTRYENGAEADLVAGVKVEVEGQLDAGGVLHARKVSFRDVVRIQAAIESVSFDGTSGTMSVLGIAVELPRFGDYVAGLGGAIGAGSVVQVRGYPTPAGGVVALRVDSKAGEERVFLQGVVSGKSASASAEPSFELMGYAVTTAGAAGDPNFFQDRNDQPMSGVSFWEAVEVGQTVVKFRARRASDVSGGTFAAEEAELEGEH
jgi:hypothetical protein